MWFKKMVDYYLKNQAEVTEVLIAFLLAFFFVQAFRPFPDMFSADIRLFLIDLMISEGLTRSRILMIGIILSLYSMVVIISLLIRGFPKFLGRLLMSIETLLIIATVSTLSMYYDRYRLSDRLILSLCYTYLIVIIIKTIKGIRRRRRHHKLREKDYWVE